LGVGDPMKIGNCGRVVIRSELAKIATSIDRLGNTDRGVANFEIWAAVLRPGVGGAARGRPLGGFCADEILMVGSSGFHA
jgi:hypothetical protein